MATVIKFGTSGWRGIIAQEFTFDNVRVATQGIADYLLSERQKRESPLRDRAPTVLLAYDTRFLGREFALAAAEVLAANGLDPLLTNRDTPTPVLAHSIRTRRALGGINFTASHNPAEYQGLKFSPYNGAPAPPDITAQIEQAIARRQAEGWSFRGSVIGTYSCRTFDPQPAYFRHLERLLRLEWIGKRRLKVLVNICHGTGRGYIDALLQKAGARVLVLNDRPDPLFGGHHPEPDAAGMAEVSHRIRHGEAKLGLGTDGDADRFGVVDSDGRWLTPNQVLVLTLYYLVKHQGWKGSVVRTVPTSHQVDAVAALFGIKVHETPVGFKYIGALMEKESVIVGGEESGGLSIRGHVPEKDGILACLLMAELMALENRPLGQILADLEKQTGPFYTERLNIRIQPEQKEPLLQRLARGVETIGPFQVQQFITTDGFKFLLPDQEWVAFRASGTEPMIRCYLEARSRRNLTRLRKACEELLRT
ncbi:MAG: phosphoglucomutase/phosphomannomutase family protein [Verrucomicrobiota bacterium]|nr:phosphoglucomutase/phosphomannomutase family protein [Limisphaera sp.]MDW8381741.1 phosphoglucomutase/phosphomannomutase family protein [Verrucomicrobiota bacterium]